MEHAWVIYISHFKEMTVKVESYQRVRLHLLVCLVLALICFISAPSRCQAWYTPMHMEITRAAFFSLPKDIRQALYPYIGDILWESVTPDVMLHDWPNHEWNVHRAEGDNTCAPAKIEAMARQILWELKSQSPDMEKVAKALGQLSHYIADINQPLHTDELPGENLIHIRYENDVFSSIKKLGTGHEGIRFINDFSDWARMIAKRANLFYEPIMDAYGSGQGLNEVYGITRRCLMYAVSDIRDAWATIWYEARPERPLRLGLCLNQDTFIPGDVIRLDLSSIIAMPCQKVDLYIVMATNDGSVSYLDSSGTFSKKTVAFQTNWRPRCCINSRVLEIPVTSKMTGKTASFYAFALRPKSSPYEAMFKSNVASVSCSFKPLPDPSAILDKIGDEPYLFPATMSESSKRQGLLLHRWDFIFLGDKVDDPATRKDESLLDFLIPGPFRHLLLYWGRNEQGRPVALEFSPAGSGHLRFAILPETEASSKTHMSGEKTDPLRIIKPLFAYRNRQAKRINPLDLKRVKNLEPFLSEQLKKDLEDPPGYQMEFGWSGNLSDKEVHLVDDGRDGGFTCTDYFLTLLEDNGSVCFKGSRIRAVEVEDYYLNSDKGKKAFVPSPWNPFPIKVTVADILGMGYRLVDPKPHLFPCDNSTEIGLPIPSKLFDSPQLVPIEPTFYPAFDPERDGTETFQHSRASRLPFCQCGLPAATATATAASSRGSASTRSR